MGGVERPWQIGDLAGGRDNRFVPEYYISKLDLFGRRGTPLFVPTVPREVITPGQVIS